MFRGAHSSHLHAKFTINMRTAEILPFKIIKNRTNNTELGGCRLSIGESLPPWGGGTGLSETAKTKNRRRLVGYSGFNH